MSDVSDGLRLQFDAGEPPVVFIIGGETVAINLAQVS
jgi:hypothetical protein